MHNSDPNIYDSDIHLSASEVLVDEVHARSRRCSVESVEAVGNFAFGDAKPVNGECGRSTVIIVSTRGCACVVVKYPVNVQFTYLLYFACHPGFMVSLSCTQGLLRAYSASLFLGTSEPTAVCRIS